MPDPISAAANVQLGMLQSPEIAREQVPIAAQAQLANEQAPNVIAKQQQDAQETVQQVAQADNPNVQDALSGNPDREPPTYRQRGRRRATPAQPPATPAAVPHPRGIGDLVDVRA